LAGVAATLEHDVLPALADRAVRGLVFAAIEVLANVQDLVEWKAAVRDEELAGAADALAGAAAALDASGRGATAGRLRAALATAHAAGEREERALALEGALEQALIAIDAEDAPDALAPAAAALRTHLVNQSLRDLLRVQRPLLDRVSRG
jgi:hypothetical protein